MINRLGRIPSARVVASALADDRLNPRVQRRAQLALFIMWNLPVRCLGNRQVPQQALHPSSWSPLRGRKGLGSMVAAVPGFSSPAANSPAISAGIISSCSPLFLRLLLCVPSVEGSGYMRHLVFWTPLPSKLTGHEIIISHVIGGVKRLFHSAEQHSRRSHLLPGETWFHLSGSLHDDVAPLLLRRSLSPHRCQPAEC